MRVGKNELHFSYDSFSYSFLQTMKRCCFISCCATALLTMLILAPVKDGVCIPDPHQRELLFQEEVSRQIGGRVELSVAERRLDSFMRKLKEKEIMDSRFPPAMHFFKAKPFIQKSPVFKLLQRMPKGILWLFIFYYFP